jgi:hypothetical protein
MSTPIPSTYISSSGVMWKRNGQKIKMNNEIYSFCRRQSVLGVVGEERGPWKVVKRGLWLGHLFDSIQSRGRINFEPFTFVWGQGKGLDCMPGLSLTTQSSEFCY